MFKITPNQKQLAKLPEVSSDAPSVKAIPESLTKENQQNLADDILFSNHSYINSLKVEIQFITEELGQIKHRLNHCVKSRTCLELTKQYVLLLNALNSCQERQAICYMASYQPLSRLLEYRESSKKSAEIEIEQKQLQEVIENDEFDPTEFYKPYQD